MPWYTTGVQWAPNAILNLPYFWMSAAHTSLPSTVKHASAPLPANAQTCLPSVVHDADASDTSPLDGLL